MTHPTDHPATDLPPLTKHRPRTRPADTRHTVRDLFGTDGQFFTVPGTYPPGLPDHISFDDTVYAVLRFTEPATGTTRFAVRDVGNRDRVGHLATDQATAVRSALTDLAYRRRKHARNVANNRVHILGREPVPPVRIGHHDDTWIVHFRCSCPHVDGLSGHAEHLSLAVADDPTPWEFCPTTEPRFTTRSGSSGRITSTGRTDQGAAVVEIEDADGHRTTVRLDEATD